MRLEQAVFRHLPTILIAGAVAVALNLVLYFTAVSRLDRFTRSVKAEVKANQAQIEQLEARDREVSTGVDHVRANKQVVDDLTGKILLTKGQRLVEVQKTLAALAEAHRLQLDTIGYSYSIYPTDQKMAWGHRFLEVGIAVPVSGPYQELKGFMRDIQDSPQFLSITSLNLAASSQGAALIQTNLALVTYFVATEQDIRDLAVKGKRP